LIDQNFGIFHFHMLHMILCADVSCAVWNSERCEFYCVDYE